MASPTPSIRWGIIGCGDVCEKKSGPAYQQTPAFELYAVSARSPGKAQDFARRHSVPHYYETAQQLIDDPSIDAIYIATPPDSHLELALLVAKAKKICCIEKPMALNFIQCQQIVDAFESQKLELFVAYYRRSLPGFIALKNALDNGKIGRIRQISWHYSRPPSDKDLSQTQNWRTDKSIALGGYFEDIASHGLNLMSYFIGPAIHAQGICSNQQQLYSAHDAIVANLAFENNVTGSASWNFGSYLYQDKMQIIGESGVMDFAVFGDSPATIATRDDSQVINMHTPNPIQGPFVQAIADHLNGTSIHPSQGESAGHTNWIMDKILGVL
ncbi:Gfo/Idh/MocA family protein [Aliiglaciecola lipolytica]|uniref:Oxidoreductase n=1 Tax=Aliiglaciecola lipolytica E3 TaxID=1127673 RepID=K6YDX2_9ALTE|nr:Gfo/Idh/MocA family oxidoreductase [Aliiglaciecola lipolytica]GAC16352.1 oxidoreductase [Aliiglaciecola lipolytica E3]